MTQEKVEVNSDKSASKIKSGRVNLFLITRLQYLIEFFAFPCNEIKLNRL